MKIRTFIRHTRSHGNSIELAIPPYFLKTHLHFHIHKKLGEYDYNQVRNKKNNKANLHIWINKKWNIEISDASSTTYHINGIVTVRELFVHGGSCVFPIPPEVLDTLRDSQNKPLDKIKMYINKNQNIELEPIY